MQIEANPAKPPKPPAFEFLSESSCLQGIESLKIIAGCHREEAWDEFHILVRFYSHFSCCLFPDAFRWLARRWHRCRAKGQPHQTQQRRWGHPTYWLSGNQVQKDVRSRPTTLSRLWGISEYLSTHIYTIYICISTYFCIAGKDQRSPELLASRGDGPQHSQSSERRRMQSSIDLSLPLHSSLLLSLLLRPVDVQRCTDRRTVQSWRRSPDLQANRLMLGPIEAVLRHLQGTNARLFSHPLV